MRKVELIISAKRRLLEKVIEETESGNIQWEYAFAEMFNDYCAKWRGKILTIRWLQDEGPRLRVFLKAKDALITYDSARNAVSLPRETKALVTCWEQKLSELNRHLCGCIAAYLKPEKYKDNQESDQERKIREDAVITEHIMGEIKEIKGILDEPNQDSPDL